MKILVVTEQREGQWNRASFETLAAAQQAAGATGATISAAVIGKGLGALAKELAGFKVGEVLAIEHDLLEKYTPDGYTLALKQAIAEAKPDFVFFPHTYQVRDFAPKLAASLGRGMIADCVGLRHENGRLVFVRQMFQGKTAADVSFQGDAPWFASFQAGAFRGDQVETGGSATPRTVAVDLKPEQIRTKPLELFRESSGGEPEIQARVHQRAHFGAIEDLAGNGYGRPAGDELPRRERFLAVLGSELQYLLPQLFRPLRHARYSRYHVTVRSNPCSKVYSGAQPSSSRARSALKYW